MMFLFTRNWILFFFIGLILFTEEAISQKLPIDSMTTKNWQNVGFGMLSPSGKYFMYSVRNLPIESQSLFVKSVDKSWEKQLVGSFGLFFSEDDKLYLKKEDSLFCIKPGSD